MVMREMIFDGHADPGGERFVLETEQRLSRSMIWSAQRSFFHHQGVDAWRTAGVPYYVTNNPALAHAYAQVILGFLRDCRAPRGGAPLDVTEPFTIVELGAGSGRFGFLFLRSFLDLHRRSSIRDVPVRYVLTDFTEKNLDFWQGHSALRPFVEEGVLDFAIFDVERDTELTLRRAGLTLSPGSLRAPIAVIANYVFDSVSQDAFSIRDGELHESLVSVSSPRPTLDLEHPAPFDGLVVTYTDRPAGAGYYPEPDLDALLRACAAEQTDATMLFPSTAIRCARRLAALSGGRMLLLSGDRPDLQAASIPRASDDMSLAIHGSFSMPVDYRIIGDDFSRKGGEVLRMSQRREHLDVLAFLLGEPGAEHPETQLAYLEAMDRAGPDDFFHLRRGVQSLYDGLELSHLLSLIRLSRYDPRIAGDCMPLFSSRIPGADEATKRDIVQTMLRVWESYYPIGEERDLAFEIGALLHEAGAPAEALSLFEASHASRGVRADACWNMGLCHLALGRRDEALACFADALERNPAFRPPAALREP